ncbi:manganese/zinc/iron transport system permease protein [Rubricella aquisinus]|uniref:Manganese/zinc/iron transport system permease protein n=1 Tax=Rubricella aquisinus TaxID=2028108 RepID=A0A840X5C5_9RHOB|nr:metal ABC transporter permease [Rubricella aquisinus]MBB5517035.1 manganese/zinc/iron transport system permease protein [Rubricella aquisinus]
MLAALSGLAGYNTLLVTLGATLLGLAAGGAGAFVFLRKRALVSDAVSHATLPGIGLAFIVMVMLGGDGRWLPGLILGSAISAGIGLLCVEWITRRTRLSEDAAIGAVLSVFFGLGIVLLTVIQGMSSGRQAGLEGFLLGSTAGMLASEAWTIAIAGAVTAASVVALRRPMTLVAFDPEYARSQGVNVRWTDLSIMALVLLVTVIGLKVVGLILIVALLVIPPVIARFWTDRVDVMLIVSALSGGIAGGVGTVVSTLAPGLPTGPVIVLTAFALFALSLLAAPRRGIFAAALRHVSTQRRVHLRQGLLSLYRGEPILDAQTLAALRRAGFIRADGVATKAGRAAAQARAVDAARWATLRSLRGDDPALEAHDGMTDMTEVLTPDQIADIDRVRGQLRGVA